MIMCSRSGGSGAGGCVNKTGAAVEVMASEAGFISCVEQEAASDRANLSHTPRDIHDTSP